MMYGSYSNDNINYLYNGKSENKPLQLHNSCPGQTYKKLSYIPYNNDNNIVPRKKKSNKRVKFNNKIDVILVESYKAYNKIEDEQLYFQEYYKTMNNNIEEPKPTINKQKGDGCVCIII